MYEEVTLHQDNRFFSHHTTLASSAGSARFFHWNAGNNGLRSPFVSHELLTNDITRCQRSGTYSAFQPLRPHDFRLACETGDQIRLDVERPSRGAAPTFLEAIFSEDVQVTDLSVEI